MLQKPEPKGVFQKWEEKNILEKPKPVVLCGDVRKTQMYMNIDIYPYDVLA